MTSLCFGAWLKLSTCIVVPLSDLALVERMTYILLILFLIRCFICAEFDNKPCVLHVMNLIAGPTSIEVKFNPIPTH